MNNGDLSFRKYEPSDRQGCLDLLQAGHDPSFSSERFAWLHERSPLSPSEIALCLAGNRIVGIYSVIKKTARLGGATYVAGRDVDPVVHSSFRGQGVFSQLLKFGLENFIGIDFFYNFANPISARGFLRQGWRSVCPLDDRVYQLGFDRPLSKEFAIWCATGAWNARRTPTSVREITPEEAAGLLANPLARSQPREPDGRIWIERSPAYLRWRYLDCPMQQYRWFSAGMADQSPSLAICRFNQDTNQLIVLDVVGFGAEPSVAPWLPLWARLFPRAWVGIWSTVPRRTRPGFIGNPLKRGMSRPFLARPFPGREPPAQLFLPDGWFVSHGDLEIS